MGTKEIRRYSQHYVDVVDVEDNTLKTLPVQDVIADDYPALRYIASQDKDDYLAPIISLLPPRGDHKFVLTFERLSKDQNFITLMHTVLKKLELAYGCPVDIEFTVDVQPGYPHAEYTLNLLQFRPLFYQELVEDTQIPKRIPAKDLIFESGRLVPQGAISGIRYIIYVDPEAYGQTPTYDTKSELAHVIGHLNKRLEKEAFILIGPGRWGSSNVDLGVKVSYADIYNAKVLLEVPLVLAGNTAEPSYGTHFFQDLVETGIFPLAVDPARENEHLNTSFLTDSRNVLGDLLPDDAAYTPYIHIDVPAVANRRYLEIVMNSEQGRAVGYLKALPDKGRKRK